MSRYSLLLFVVVWPLQAAPPAGYSPKVSVSAPTRLDWTFTVTNQSLPDPPADLLGDGYDSTKQSYELFVPPQSKPGTPLPAILFISAGDSSSGWKSFEPVCKKLGFVFIGVRGAGNNVPSPKRCRIILDCFDDVRRTVPLDPGRSYISGFSGGGRIACGIGFALPEYFAGILPLCAGGDLRSESWLRRRAADRLSVALVTGTRDFNRGEVEVWKGPLWSELGIRTKVFVQPNLGHGLPSSTTLTDAITWLEQDRPRRAAFAKSAPSSCADPSEVPDREKEADTLAREASAKFANPKTFFAGLMQMKGVHVRWPDTKAGRAARLVLERVEQLENRPWEADDIAEQRKTLAAEARAIGNYALKGIPKGSQYEQFRPTAAKKAIESWKLLIADDPESELAKEGQTAIEQLDVIASK